MKVSRTGKLERMDLHQIVPFYNLLTLGRQRAQRRLDLLKGGVGQQCVDRWDSAGPTSEPKRCAKQGKPVSRSLAAIACRIFANVKGQELAKENATDPRRRGYRARIRR